MSIQGFSSNFSIFWTFLTKKWNFVLVIFYLVLFWFSSLFWRLFDEIFSWNWRVWNFEICLKIVERLCALADAAFSQKNLKRARVRQSESVALLCRERVTWLRHGKNDVHALKFRKAVQQSWNSVLRPLLAVKWGTEPENHRKIKFFYENAMTFYSMTWWKQIVTVCLYLS